MKKTITGFLMVFCCGVIPVLAEEPVFHFSREVKTSKQEQEELLSITLDNHVFSATQSKFPDIRLIDGEEQVVSILPRKVQTTRARKVRKNWTARDYTAKPIDDGGLEIIVELDEQDPHAKGLSLVTSMKNFEQRVRIYNSADSMTWEPVGKETVIFDYSRYIDVRNVSLSFPETEKRHFRIVIDDVTVEQESELLSLTRQLRGEEETSRAEQITIERRPFRIERVEFWGEVEQKQSAGDKKGNYPVGKFQVEQDSENQQTIIHIDTQRQPLTSFELNTPVKNFSRHVVVERKLVKGETSSWQKIGESTISRIDFKNLKRENLSISFSESRQAQYRIVIDNRDNTPLEISGIEAEGNVYELAFLSTPGTQYQLLYGATDAPTASYDTAAIKELLRTGFQPSQVEMGSPQPIEAAPKPEPEFKWAELLNNPTFLGVVITLLVLILGWGLYHAVKRMDDLPED